MTDDPLVWVTPYKPRAWHWYKKCRGFARSLAVSLGGPVQTRLSEVSNHLPECGYCKKKKESALCATGL